MHRDAHAAFAHGGALDRLDAKIVIVTRSVADDGAPSQPAIASSTSSNQTLCIRPPFAQVSRRTFETLPDHIPRREDKKPDERIVRLLGY